MRLALFDLDDTLLTGDSVEQWIDFLIDRGVLNAAATRATNREMARRYEAGEVSPEEYSRFDLGILVGHSRADLDAWNEDFMRQCIVPGIPLKAMELLAEHRDIGDVMVLTTATNRFLSEPIAKYLDIEHLIATEPESADGKFTGNFTGIPNMREGKVKRLDGWLDERGYSWLDFAETWFYSDSHNDIPLLNRVSRPVAVDPDARLAAHAHARGWPVLRLRTAD